ncbi:MAG: ATP synthase F1 subunit epsilon [Verrucomicrobia bacterium]|nr:ATP synthase F1 subunit epsilon [Verrucomicrobiota bacterium]
MPLDLTIVTPEKCVLQESVEHVVLPTQHAGEIDVLPGHLPLVTVIEPGELRYHKDGKAVSVAIDKGFIEVSNDCVAVLTEAALEVDNVDASFLDNAKSRAEAALAEARSRNEDPAVLEELELKARFAVLQKIIADKKGRV